MRRWYALLADAMVESAGDQRVEHSSYLGVASEAMQRARCYVDIGSRWRIDFLVIEQEHQVAFEHEECFFFVVVNVRWGDDARRAEFFKGGRAAVGRRGGR